MHQSSLGYVAEAERFGGKRALVLGGSIAGLTAAAMLARHFDEVTLIERDVLDDAANLRKGTPQAQHLHALLLRGIEGIEALLPGTKAELRAGGAVDLQFGNTFQWYHGGGFKAPYKDGHIGLAQSRPFLESVVRRRVRALANVRILDGTEVLGLIRSADGRGIEGARIQARTEGAKEEAERADLVVDATGRGSRGVRWLSDMGFETPEVSEVRVDVGYASRVFERPADAAYSWRMLYVLGTVAERSRFGAITAIEGSRWALVLGGLLKDYPPGDEEGFLAFAKSLPHPGIYEFIKKEKPLSDIVTYRFPSHQRRHFERLSRLPEGFLSIGDSVASLNPIYGQGMTTAIVGVETLDGCLREARRKVGAGVLAGFPKMYHTKLGHAIDVPWMMSTGEDLANPGVIGTRPHGFAAMRAFVDRVHIAAKTDPDVARRFYDVMNMLESPASLFHPDVLLPVARIAVNDVRRRLG